MIHNRQLDDIENIIKTNTCTQYIITDCMGNQWVLKFYFQYFENIKEYDTELTVKIHLIVDEKYRLPHFLKYVISEKNIEFIMSVMRMFFNVDDYFLLKNVFGDEKYTLLSNLFK